MIWSHSVHQLLHSTVVCPLRALSFREGLSTDHRTPECGVVCALMVYQLPLQLPYTYVTPQPSISAIVTAPHCRSSIQNSCLSFRTWTATCCLHSGCFLAISGSFLRKPRNNRAHLHPSQQSRSARLQHPRTKTVRGWLPRR